MDQFQKFYDERLAKDLRSAQEAMAATQTEIEEYQALSSALDNIQKSGQDHIKTRVEVGDGVWMTAKVDDVSTVIVRLSSDGLFASLPLPRALVFIEKRLGFLGKRMEEGELNIAQIKTTMDAIKLGMAQYNAIEEKKKGGK